MKLVRARLDRGVYNAAGRVAELRGEVAALQPEFLNGVRRWSDRRIAAHRRAAIKLDVVVDAVKEEVVLPQVHAVDGEKGAVRGAGITARLTFGVGSLSKCSALIGRIHPSNHTVDGASIELRS